MPSIRYPARLLAYVLCGALAASISAAATAAAVQHDSTAVYYTLIAEIALARGEPRSAALAYVSAATNDPRLWPRATAVARDLRQPTVAFAAAEHWAALEPASLAARRNVAAAALALYQPAIAADAYRFVIANAGDGVESAFGEVAARLLHAEDPYAARCVADRLAGYFPNSFAARRLQGFAALQANDPQAAAQAFVLALALVPSADRAASAERRAILEALHRARVLAGDGGATLAEAQALARRQGTPGDRYDYAILLLAAHRNDDAREQLRGIASDRRFGPDATRLIALVDFQSGEYPRARRRFERLLAGGHYADEAHYYLGLIAERDHDRIGALRELAAVRQGEQMLPAVMRAASLLRAQGADTTADQLIGELLDAEPERAPEIAIQRAELDARAGRYAEALAIAEQAAREYPDLPSLAYARAMIEDEAGHTDAALGILHAVLEARPTDPEALNAYGYTLADHGRELDRAQGLIRRALAAAPVDPAFRDSLAWALYRRGQVASALVEETAAYRDSPGAEIGAHLGELLWRLGRQSQAERIWTEAARFDPHDLVLERTRSRLIGRPASAVK
ncbi:MAG: tetratricopeptide repeat protein [Gammaproteobacteria bacterium]|nr:tetratricopeptide repeat protein [Gammaproteobacteria bacterium]